MYRQIDNVAMGYLFGAALGNVFLGYYKKDFFRRNNKPVLYFRCVDDILAIFNVESVSESFLSALNCLHPCLTFSFVEQADGKLPFLDFLIEKAESEFFTSKDRTTIFYWAIYTIEFF